jgi:hypothetical protein
MQRAGDGIKGAGSKAVESVKQHPVAASVVGEGLAAGVAYLASRAFRGSGQQRPGESDQQRPQDQMEQEDEGQEQAEGMADEGEESGEEGEEEEEGDSESDDEDASNQYEQEQGEDERGRTNPTGIGQLARPHSRPDDRRG